MKPVYLLLIGLLSGMVVAETPANHQISVTGIGSVAAQPTELSFTVTVEEKGQLANQLSQQVNSKVQKLLKHLTKNGVRKENIQALHVNLYPWIEREDRRSIQKGFVVSRKVTVLLKELEDYPEIMDGMMELGLTQIDNLQYKVAAPHQLYLQALQEAMENARSRAESIAKSAGVTVGKVISVNEMSGHSPYPQPMRAHVMAAESDAFMPGQISNQAQVNVVFAIE